MTNDEVRYEEGVLLDLLRRCAADQMPVRLTARQVQRALELAEKGYAGKYPTELGD